MTCEVCGHSDYYTESGNLNIPATIENGETYTVIGVADYSFEGNESYTFNDIDGYWNLDISSISFPSTIQYIGKYAFDSCKKLRGINLPESVVEIGEGAFRNCIEVRQIRFPNTLKRINKKTFQNCLSLSELKLPNNIEYIGDNAFASCKALDEIILPRGIKEIGQFAFNYCNSIKSLFIPNTMERIGSSAFAMKEHYITSLTIEDGEKPLYIGSSNFYAKDLDVYVGRTLTSFGIGNVMNSAKVKIGPLVTDVYRFFYEIKIKSYGSITLYCTTPPTLGDFDSEFFSKFSVYVPVGTKNEYENARFWKRFSYYNEVTPPTYYSLIGDFNGGEFPGAVFTKITETTYNLNLPILKSDFKIVRNFSSTDLYGSDNSPLKTDILYNVKPNGEGISLDGRIKEIHDAEIHFDSENNLLSVFGANVIDSEDYLYLIGNHNDWAVPFDGTDYNFDTWKLYLNEDGEYENTFSFPPHNAAFYFISIPQNGEYIKYGPSYTSNQYNVLYYEYDKLSTEPTALDLTPEANANYAIEGYYGGKLKLRVNINRGILYISLPSAEFSGIDDIVNDSSFVNGTVIFYDLYGHRISNPQKGLYIKVYGGKSEKIFIK